MTEFEQKEKKNAEFIEAREFPEVGRLGGGGRKKRFAFKQKKDLSQSIKEVAKGMAVAAAGIIIVESAFAMTDPEGFANDMNSGIGGDPSPSSVRELIASEDHIWGDEGIVIKEATCKEKGILRFICKICGLEKDEDIPLADHTPSEEEGVEATCTEAGHFGNLVCSVCGEVLGQGEPIPALGHNWGPAFTALDPTCTATGISRVVCLRCGLAQDSRLAALGHNWGTAYVAQEPTCTVAGINRITCLRCGANQDTAIAATGHVPGEMIDAVEPTCLEAGLEELHCAVCDAVMESHEVAALGHDDGETVVVSVATCTTDGMIQLVCGRCGEVLAVSASMALGHIDDDSNFVCERCNEILVDVYATGGSHAGYEVVASFRLGFTPPAEYNTDFWVSVSCEDYLGAETVMEDGSSDFTVYLYPEADNPNSEWYFSITVHNDTQEIVTKRFVLDDHFIVSPAD